MKVKGQLFRKSIVSQQRNEIMAEIRTKMLKHMEVKTFQEQINDKIQQYLNNHDILGFHEQFIRSNKQLFAFINKIFLSRCFELFSSDLSNYESIYLLQHLALKHFQSAFTNKELKCFNEKVINILCNEVPICISQIINQEYHNQSQSVNQRLNSCLRIIGMYFQPKYKKYTFEGANQQSCSRIEQILSWNTQLSTKKAYLNIIANMLENLQAKPYFYNTLSSLMSNQQFIDQILDNIFSNQQERSLDSCHIFFNLIQNFQITTSRQIQIFLPNILKILQTIYDKSNRQTSRFKQIHFVKCLKCMKILLSIVRKYDKNSQLYLKLLTEHKLLDILVYVDQAYFFPQKRIVFQIIQLTFTLIVQFAQNSDIQLMIPQRIIQNLALGLKNTTNDFIVLSCLKSLQLLIKYFNNRQQILEHFVEYGVSSTLQNLQYKNNTQISEMSISLLQNEFNQQRYHTWNFNGYI